MNGKDATAVVLLSGGLDSSTTLAMAKSRGFRCHALTFDYGQRHRYELEAAGRIARAMGVAEHRIVRIDLSAQAGFGHSALTDDIAVPKERLGDWGTGRLGEEERRGGERRGDGGTGRLGEKNEARGGAALPETGEHIPVTYVPARNTIFLAIALGYAEVGGAFDIFIGVNAVDYSGYPDCRPVFVEAFEKLANLATAAGVEGRGRFRIHAPLIRMTKADIIRTGLALGVDYSLTHSCYDPSPEGLSCGRCDSCRLRLRGFQEAGAKDPARYR